MKLSIGRKFSVEIGHTLLNWSKCMLRKGYNIDYYTISSNDLANLVKQQIGCEYWLWDGKYWFTSLEAWKRIVTSDKLNETKQYKLDRFDCDNFAIAFSAHVAENYDLNSAGIAIGAVLDKDNKLLGYHAYNCLIVKNGDKTELWLYEPQTDHMNKASRETVMGGVVYRTDLIIIWA